jgi:hypothetical protein
MGRELRRLRAAIESSPRDVKGQRQFGPALREEMVSFVRAQIAEGSTQKEAAAELGIAARLVRYWIQQEESPLHEEPLGDAALREVVVESQRPSSTRGERRVVLRSGVEIVGLELDELIEIARALS